MRQAAWSHESKGVPPPGGAKRRPHEPMRASAQTSGRRCKRARVAVARVAVALIVVARVALVSLGVLARAHAGSPPRESAPERTSHFAGRAQSKPPPAGPARAAWLRRGLADGLSGRCHALQALALQAEPGAPDLPLLAQALAQGVGQCKVGSALWSLEQHILHAPNDDRDENTRFAGRWLLVALARLGTEDALEHLAYHLDNARDSSSAEQALAVTSPRSLEPFSLPLPSEMRVRWVAEQAGFAADTLLVRWADSDDEAIRLAAMAALLERRPHYAQALATRWLTLEARGLESTAAAIGVWLRTSDPRAIPALRELLRAAPSTAARLLAQGVPAAARDVVLAAVNRYEPALRRAFYPALQSIPAHASAALLAADLGASEAGVEALNALVAMHGVAAQQALRRIATRAPAPAGQDNATVRNDARAFARLGLILRRLQGADDGRLQGADDEGEAATPAASDSPGQAWLNALDACSQRVESCVENLLHGTDWYANAALQLMPLAGDNAFATLGDRLNDSPALSKRLGIALLREAGRDRVSTRVLMHLLPIQSPWQPWVVRALAERLPSEELASWLQHPSRARRLQTALGLGRNPNPGSVYALRSAYPLEADDGVRRAMVRAVAWLEGASPPSPWRRAVAASDPAANVRATAVAPGPVDAATPASALTLIWAPAAPLAALHCRADDGLGPPTCDTPLPIRLVVRPEKTAVTRLDAESPLQR